jgi:hypothetical protein
LTILKFPSKSTIVPSWVDSLAGIANVTPMGGQARKLPSLYECILAQNTMQGSIINDARVATVSANRTWMIHMPKESHIVSKSGVEYRWTCPTTQVKARAHTIVIYAKGARMVIAVN